MEKLYLVSMVRSVHTRTKRASAAERTHLRQFACDGSIRLVRSRYQPLSEAWFTKYYDELWKLQESGRVEIRIGSPEGPAYKFGEKNNESEQIIESESSSNDGSEGKESSEGDIESSETSESELIEESEDVDLEEEEEEEEEDEEEEGVEVSDTPEKPVDKMNKAELIEYAAATLDINENDLEGLTKRQILSKLG